MCFLLWHISRLGKCFGLFFVGKAFTINQTNTHISNNLMGWIWVVYVAEKQINMDHLMTKGECSLKEGGCTVDDGREDR